MLRKTFSFRGWYRSGPLPAICSWKKLLTASLENAEWPTIPEFFVATHPAAQVHSRGRRRTWQDAGAGETAMKTNKWDDVHRAVEKRDGEGLRRMALAASRKQTRILLSLLADMLDQDARRRRPTHIALQPAKAVAAAIRRAS
jgi:hypothetical protein